MIVEHYSSFAIQLYNPEFSFFFKTAGNSLCVETLIAEVSIRAI